MVNRLEKPMLLRPVCCPRDFINEPDTSNRCKGLGCRAGYKPFCLFVRKDEISEWYSLFCVHNTTSLQAWVFQHLLYIWLLNKYLLITKIKKYIFFPSTLGKAHARHWVFSHLVLTAAEK